MKPFPEESTEGQPSDSEWATLLAKMLCTRYLSWCLTCFILVITRQRLGAFSTLGYAKANHRARFIQHARSLVLFLDPSKQRTGNSPVGSDLLARPVHQADQRSPICTCTAFTDFAGHSFLSSIPKMSGDALCECTRLDVCLIAMLLWTAHTRLDISLYHYESLRILLGELLSI